MKKVTLLKFLNPLLFLSGLVQISTITIMKINPVPEIMPVHEFNGLLLGAIILFHLVLNWGWIGAAYFPEKNKNGMGAPVLNKYKCGICGYIYDPALGDPDSGIAPGTAFEDLLDNWACPNCGASKDQFEAF